MVWLGPSTYLAYVAAIQKLKNFDEWSLSAA